MIEYSKATIEEYGYKDRCFLKKVYRISTKVLVVAVIFLMYLPVLTIALQSFNSSSELSSFGSFTFKWYGQIFRHPMLASAIQNTAIVSLTSTILATVLGTFIAMGIYYLFPKAKQQILLLNNIPILNADIVTGISLMLVFSLLLPVFPYIFGLPTLILAHLFFTLPYVILSVLPKLGEVDPNLMDAAADLGLKPIKSLVKVMVPAVKAGIFSGMLLAFTMSVDDFVVSYYTTGNGYDNLSIWIYGSIGRKSLTPSVYAFSTLLTLGTALVLLAVNLLSKRKVRNK